MTTPFSSLTRTDFVFPRLSLNWKTGVTQPGVDVARAGVATFVGSNGLIQSATADTQRIDWSPGIPALLIEESRTNNLIRSEEFGSWSTFGGETSVTTNTNISPDGAMTADTVTGVSGLGRLLSNSISVTAGQTYTFSCYMYQIVAGSTLIFGPGMTASFTISPQLILNQWVRVVFTYTAASTTTAGFQIRLGSGVSIAMWGAQHELGAFASSYIPTEAVTVTRNADVATITGTNFSDFWQSANGGAMVQVIPSTISGIRTLVQYDDGTADNIIALRGNAADPELYIVDGGAPQVQLDAGTIVAKTPYSLTGWWDTDDCRARKDSGAVVTDTTATIPTVTQARLGSDGTNYLNGHLAMVNYYDMLSSQIYARRKNKAVFSLF